LAVAIDQPDPLTRDYGTARAYVPSFRTKTILNSALPLSSAFEQEPLMDGLGTLDGQATKRTTDPLLAPFRLKHLLLKNRVMSTSHAISYQDDGKPKQRYQLYHEEKAKGGIALTMFGGASNIAPDSASLFGQLDVSNDDIIPYFQEFADRIHRHDCALMCQITHMGRRTTSYGGNWLPVIAPSRTRDAYTRSFPKEWTRTISPGWFRLTRMRPIAARRADSTDARCWRSRIS
jgi:hypothetical protein